MPENFANKVIPLLSFIRLLITWYLQTFKTIFRDQPQGRGHQLKYFNIFAGINICHLPLFLPTAINLWNSLPENIVIIPDP